MADRWVYVRDSGGDYSSLSAALTGEYASYPNLITGLDGILHIVIETATVQNLSGSALPAFTSDATHYLIIEAGSGYATNGVYSTSVARLESSNAYFPALEIPSGLEYFQIYGMQIRHQSATPYEKNLVNKGSSSLIDRCLVIGGEYGIYDKGTGNRYRNSVVRSTTSHGIWKGENGGIAYLDNVTVGACGGYGIAVGSWYELQARNCYSGGNASADFYETENGTLTLTTCASEDGSESTTAVAYSTSSGAYFGNVTAGTEDFRIGSSSSLDAAGTAIAGNTYDAQGETWESPPAIGAYEYISAGGSSPVPLIMQSLDQFGGGACVR